MTKPYEKNSNSSKNSKNSIDNSPNEEYTLNQIIKFSPHLNTYLDEFYNKIIHRPNLEKFYKKLSRKNILYLSTYKYPLKFQLDKLYQSKNNKIMRFQVAFSFFVLVINVLNLTDKDQIQFQFDYIVNEGMYGKVYETQCFNKKFAVKQLHFSGTNHSKVINNAIKQYSFLKLLSAFQVAPVQQNIFGFDLVTTDKGVYFSTELCIPLERLGGMHKNIDIEKMRQQLKRSLFIMHNFNITHFGTGQH